MAAYDTILKEVGGWGAYQKWICFLLAVSALPNGYFTLILVFTSKTPEHRCRVWEIDGTDVNSSANFNVAGLEDYIPWDKDNGRYDRCHRYVDSANTSLDHRSVEKCNSYVYDLRPGERTAVTEWNLVCDQAHIKPRITSTYIGGLLVGSIISGVLADWFGRWCVFICGTYLQFLFMGINVFSQNPTMYAILMFVAGSTQLMNFVAGVVIGTEIVDVQYRAFVENAIMIFYAIGYMLLPIFAYLLADWKMLLLGTGLTGILYIPSWWLIPESPRWLITHRKLDKARDMLRAIAKRNGAEVNIDHLLSEENLKLICTEEKGAKGQWQKKNGRKCCVGDRMSYLDLFTKPGMWIRTVCICCSWCIIAMAYYTVSLNTGNMGGSDIINCFIFAAVEIPAYLSVYLILRNKGRRWLMIGYLFLSAAMCGLTPLLARWNEIASIVSAMCGKFLVTSLFSLVYLFTTELFPTEARNQAVGIGSVCARLGSIFSPYIVFLGESFGKDIPYVIVGCLALTTGLIDYFLPETRSVPLPDTFVEANVLKR